jgi:hypothetical protein
MAIRVSYNVSSHCSSYDSPVYISIHSTLRYLQNMSNSSAEPSGSAFETHVQLKRETSSWDPAQILTANDLTSVAGPALASCLLNVETLKGMAPSKKDSAEEWIRHRKAHEAEKNTRNSLIEGYECSAFLADLGNCLSSWEYVSAKVGRSLTTAKKSIEGIPEGVCQICLRQSS